MKPYILILAILLSLTFVTAESYIGENSFYAGAGYINHMDAIQLSASQAMVNVNVPPVTGDVTGDGETNIVVFDNDRYLKVYEGTTLTGISNQILEKDVNNLYLYNWNGGSAEELFIIAGQTLYFYSYDTDTNKFEQFRNITFNIGSNVDPFGYMGCTNKFNPRNISACLVIMGDHRKSSAHNLKVYGFSEYGYNPGEFQLTDAAFPSCATKPLGADIDYMDGSWYFSYLYNEGPLDSGVYFRTGRLDVNATNESDDNTDGFLEENFRSEFISHHAPGNGLVDGGSCTTHYPYVSGVVYENFDQWESTGLESVVGVRTGDSSYKLIFYDNNLDVTSTVGNLDSGDGNILSNVAVLDGADSTLDACVGGYMTGGGMSMLCGTWGSGYTGYEIFYERENLDPVTEGGFPYKRLIYSTEQLRRTVEGENDIIKNEFVTPYGVLIPTDCTFLTNNCEFNPLNTLGVSSEDYNPNSLLQIGDFDDTGRTDLIKTNRNLLAYYDDGFTNNGAQISQMRIDPCLDQPWQFNTTVLVHVTAIDDRDKVSTRVTLYAGTDHEQVSNWTSYTTEGNEITHSFVANHTTTSGIIKIEARDQISPSNIDTEDLSFNVVGTGGAELGECISIISSNTSYDDEDGVGGGGREEGEPGSAEDNTIKDGIETAAGEFGIPITVLFILAWLIIIYQVWKSPITESQPTLSFGIVLLVSVGMLILGVKVGVISVGFIITLSILGLIPIALMLGKKIVGGF